MIDESIDVIATFLAIVAPLALALFVIVLIIAYPWLLLVVFGLGYLVVRYGSDEVPPATGVSDAASATNASRPNYGADGEAARDTST